GVGLARQNTRLIKEIDHLVVVVEPFRVTLTMARELLKELETSGVGKINTSIVLVNRTQSTLQVPWQEAEQLLGHEMLSIVSPAPELAFQAVEAKHRWCCTNQRRWLPHRSARLRKNSAPAARQPGAASRHRTPNPAPAGEGL